MQKLLEIIVTEGMPATWNELAQKIEISRISMYKWRKDPKFQEWLADEIKQNYSESIPRVKQVILDRALKGEYNFSKLFMEMCGELKKEDEEKLKSDIIFKAEINGNSISVTASKQSPTPDN